MRRFDGWRLQTEHVTTFSYDGSSRSSYNEVRQIPITTPHQTVLESRIHTNPGAAQFAYWDYWGTQVVAFNVDAAHESLIIRGSSLVETQPPQPIPDATWDDMAAARQRHAELMVPSRFTQPDSAVAAAARELRATTPGSTVEAVGHWVHQSLGYVRGVTGVQTAATEALANGSGVCQDFAHLSLAVLRAVGIPARYVSGYLHPDPEAVVGTQATGESHAWVEVWTGGWWGLDPTNDIEIGLRHVVVSRGRDYADVPPVRGIYAGSATHVTSVNVEITRTM